MDVVWHYAKRIGFGFLCLPLGVAFLLIFGSPWGFIAYFAAWVIALRIQRMVVKRLDRRDATR